MTIPQLKALDAFARTGHMGRAAALLYISEPALSTALSKLEKELSLTLLTRTGRTVSLTEDGWLLASHARQVLSDLDAAERHMRERSENTRRLVRVGYVTPLARQFMPSKMREFLNTAGNEDTRFETESGVTGDLVRGLKNGSYDFILCSDPGEDASLKKDILITQRILLISPEGSPLKVKTVKELESLPLIGYPRGGAMDTFLSVFQSAQGISLRFVSRAPDESAIAAMVQQNLGAAVVAEVYGLSDFPLSRQELSEAGKRTLFLITRADQTLRGAAGTFADFLRNNSDA